MEWAAVKYLQLYLRMLQRLRNEQRIIKKKFKHPVVNLNFPFPYFLGMWVGGRVGGGIVR